MISSSCSLSQGTEKYVSPTLPAYCRPDVLGQSLHKQQHLSSNPLICHVTLSVTINGHAEGFFILSEGFHYMPGGLQKGYC